MSNKFVFILVAVLFATQYRVCAKKKKSNAVKKTDFISLPSSIRYKIAQHGLLDTYQAKEGDFIKLHIRVSAEDSTIFDTYKMNNNEPAPAFISKPQFNGDIMEVIALMKKGDSAVAIVHKDSLFRQGPASIPEIGKPYQEVRYDIKIVELKSKQKYEEEKAIKQKQQKMTDELVIQNYINNNHLEKAVRTPSGLYYLITQKGGGKAAQTGTEVSVNYTGKVTDGKVFDSNTDPKFNHVQPFSFVLGKGQVIKGWDEGLALLNEGDKAILIIPSGLAYGENPPPGSPIKENDVLIFEVELLKK